MAYYKYKRKCRKCSREYLVKEIPRSSPYCRDCRIGKGLVKRVFYNSTFYKNRLIVLERDKNKCRNCSSIKKKLHIHHIDCNKSNNSLSNLITLCDTCHQALHGIYTKEELRKGDIFSLFSKMNIKKVQEKIDFLEKLKIRIAKKKKQKKFKGIDKK